ncbi:MAG TPA: DUF1249 domain-containing protein [Cycloclasticus sp.]|jgi:uncharacterized protein YqiB (DUF1249 family)|nr:DUF1249 domain-containing protein [Cycloclasticus sp.]HIL92696.1 DUF1249 domain-containing protein [Cycloclasticus sp.]
MLSQVRPINKSFCLQVLCEDNFRKLFRLIPNLSQNNNHDSTISSKILTSGPYTHTILLQHQSAEPSAQNPSFKCRVYLDTQSVEVISIEGNLPPNKLQETSPKDILNNKWALNYFLEKWLIFQLQLLNAEQNIVRTISA